MLKIYILWLMSKGNCYARIISHGNNKHIDSNNGDSESIIFAVKNIVTYDSVYSTWEGIEA
jgi:hypothetical protein